MLDPILYFYFIMKDHLNLNTPCIETYTKKRHNIPIRKNGKGSSKSLSRLICLAYLNKNIDSGDGVVCHACNNEICINPLHLYLGTQKDNINDQILSGTHNYENLGRYSKNSTCLWKCVSPDNVITYRIGLTRAAKQGNCCISVASKSYSNMSKTKNGWQFFKVRQIFNKF